MFLFLTTKFGFIKLQLKHHPMQFKKNSSLFSPKMLPFFISLIIFVFK